jgi:hypothetical protein
VQAHMFIYFYLYNPHQVGVAYLLALENVNDLDLSPVDNIQLDK